MGGHFGYYAAPMDNASQSHCVLAICSRQQHATRIYQLPWLLLFVLSIKCGTTCLKVKFQGESGAQASVGNRRRQAASTAPAKRRRWLQEKGLSETGLKWLPRIWIRDSDAGRDIEPRLEQSRRPDRRQASSAG
jgi:hypothetical protein